MSNNPSVSMHPQLNSSSSIQLFDLLQNIYINNVIFSLTIYDTLKYIIERFIEELNF